LSTSSFDKLWTGSIPDHLETFVRNMLSDDGDEFLGGKEFEVLLVGYS